MSEAFRGVCYALAGFLIGYGLWLWSRPLALIFCGLAFGCIGWMARR